MMKNISNKKLSITFKNHEKETGLRAVAHPYTDVDIKLNKQIIGLITSPKHFSSYWKVMFSVLKTEIDDNPNCNWKWITMKVNFATKDLAKEFVKLNIDQISNKYTFKEI